MTNYLIPYIQLHPPDPLFSEYTYGDSGQRGSNLISHVEQGGFLFFHTSISGKRYITAYYVVDRVLHVAEAGKNDLICQKYRNHHLLDYLERKTHEENEVIVFGDPLTSYVLEKRLLFDRKLAEKLSLGIPFSETRTENQNIASATRKWRELTPEDIKVLQHAIKETDKTVPEIKLLSSEEVAESLERDIEDFIANGPGMLGEGLKFAGRQKRIDSGRIDLLFEDEQNNLVVVEVKLNKIGRQAINQARRYLDDYQTKDKSKKVRGIIVCSGVMPAFEEELRRQRDIKILTYGWQLKIQDWEE